MSGDQLISFLTHDCIFTKGFEMDWARIVRIFKTKGYHIEKVDKLFGVFDAIAVSENRVIGLCCCNDMQDLEKTSKLVNQEIIFSWLHSAYCVSIYLLNGQVRFVKYQLVIDENNEMIISEMDGWKLI